MTSHQNPNFENIAGPERPHIYICLFICGVSALGYFAMLSGQGWTAIAGCRQFFYARYFDWAVTCSLIVLNLGLIAGADAASIAATMAAEGRQDWRHIKRL